ncbi:hypothetical protein GBF38_011728 [Nibea albiflora]|uniref:Uncharacterized protein n=1 Tax=Nibea albiflora TaxID=240163 RepID=A0ACB7F4K5_NIBAL|nr:hypothetical protein GBF38_011728 [Nibea albiflora]
MCTLFACEDPSTWRRAYEKYWHVVEAKAKAKGKKPGGKLLDLDKWPRLQQLVASNSEDTVEKCSRKAFSLLPDVQAAIAELSSLKGVGPATASAVIAAGAPEQTAFMSDEAMESVPGLKPIQYTAKHYALYLGKMVERTEKLNKVDPHQDWTPHRLEMCLWAMTIAKQQQLPLLKDVDAKASSVTEKCSDADADQRPAKKLKTR